MSIGIGSSLGAYQITARLGAGGMGEVFRARDGKLKRDVAIKILPDGFARDPERVARFRREAEALAALNHQNIAAIYDLQYSDTTPFLVMELVEGETLAERIAPGPIAVDESLAIARQIAEALEAAHERGIMHRDLKPANIKVTPDGKVKVLDFGLAKAFTGDQADVRLSESPTLSIAATQQGVILGTAAYMSPEQAKGRSVDKRADIWAYGCVLYEMLVGSPAFPGTDTHEVLAGVIRAEPLWSALPQDLHPRLIELLQRCLEKNALERWRDIGDVRLEIQRISTHPDSSWVSRTEIVQPQKRSRSLGRWIVATFLATVVMSSLTAWDFWPRFPSIPPTRFAVSVPEDGSANGVALSPDGRRLVFEANGKLYMRSMGDLETRSIPGTQGAKQPFFSPDARWIAFFTNNQLKKVAVDGSAVISVADIKIGFGGLVGTWDSNDRIIFGVGGPSGLFQVSANGGEPKPLAKLEDYQDLDYPEVLPGGEWLLYGAQRDTPVSIKFEIVAQSLITGKRTVVLQGGKFARYVPTGHLVYEQLGSLFAVGFDLKTLTVAGAPIPLGEHVATDISYFSPALFAVARDGTLAFVPGHDASKRHLVWVNRAGHPERVESLPQRAYAAPRFSPDGKRILVLVEDVGDFWVYDMRGSSIRLTQDGLSIHGTWSADGSRIVYSVGRSGTEGRIFLGQASDGSGKPYQLTDDQKSAPDYATLTLATEWPGRTFSPDRKWFAYQSSESGRDEVYVAPYPGPGGKFAVSNNGGTQPVWARNGELFYRNGSRMLVVETSTVPSLKIGQPRVVFEGPYELGPAGPRDNTNYDVTADGQRFLMVVSDEPALRPQIDVVLNWFDELKQHVPQR